MKKYGQHFEGVEVETWSLMRTTRNLLFREIIYLNSILNFGIPPVLVFQFRSLLYARKTSLTAQEKGTIAWDNSTKTSLIVQYKNVYNTVQIWANQLTLWKFWHLLILSFLKLSYNHWLNVRNNFNFWSSSASWHWDWLVVLELPC